MNSNQVQNQACIFLHIPKTAGTTLKHIFQHQYEPKEVFELYSLQQKPRKGIDEYLSLSKKQQSRIKMITGHIGFGLHEYLDRPYKYITVLRNPVKRVISYYQLHQRRKPQEIAARVSLEEFVRTWDSCQNDMTKYLSQDKIKAQLTFAKDHIHSPILCTQSSLEQAKLNLKQNIEVVGLLEQFDQTLILLKRNLGWKVFPYVKHNVTKNRSQAENIPTSTLELIRSLNQFDIQLYDYAKELFAASVLQQGDGFQEEVAELSRNNDSASFKIYFTLSSTYHRLTHKYLSYSNPPSIVKTIVKAG
jgi:hypothetical protein